MNDTDTAIIEHEIEDVYNQNETDENPKPKGAVLHLIAIIAVFYAGRFLFVFLHELGHLLVFLLHGRRVDAFVVLPFSNAHVIGDSTGFSTASLALMNMGGDLFALIVLAVAILLYRRENKHALYHSCYKLSAILLFLYAISQWFFVSVSSLVSAPSLNYDAMRLLVQTGLHPLIMLLFTLLLAVIFVILSYKKGLLKPPNISNPADIMTICIYAGLLFVITARILSGYSTSEYNLNVSFSATADEVKNRRLSFTVETESTYEIITAVKAGDGIAKSMIITEENGDFVSWYIFDLRPIEILNLNLKKGNYIIYIEIFSTYDEAENYIVYKWFSEITQQMKEHLETIFIQDISKNEPVTFYVQIRQLELEK